MDISRILSSLPDAALCGVYIYSFGSGRNEYINASYTEITGWGLGDIQQMGAESFMSLFHPGDLGAIQRHMDSMLESPIGEAQEIEYRFRHKKGHYVWCKSRDVVVESSDNGAPLFFMGSFIDISDQKTLEVQLSSSEERLKLAADAAEIGIWDYDLQAGVSINDRRVHEQFDMDWGGTNDAGVWFGRIHRDDVDMVQKAIEEAIAGNGEYDARYRVCWRDGSVHHLLAKGRVIRDAVGNPLRLLGMNIDITDEVELQQQVEQKQKMDAIGQLAGGIAHDFNNQLVAILGNADLLRYRMGESELQCYVDSIIKAANRSANLTKQLLNYARRGVSMEKQVNVEELIHDVVDILRHSIDKRIEIAFDFKEPNAHLLADESNLQSALLNLALNARDAMPEGGTLTFATVSAVVKSHESGGLNNGLNPGRYLRISVMDTGIGMSEAILEQIREPFFTTKEVGKGTGLGLPACEGIVRRHGGELTIESIEGEGTTMHIFLPFQTLELEEQRRSSQIAEVKGSAQQILVIDDEEISIEIVEAILSDHGHKVYCETSPLRALEYYDMHHANINLVLLDMTMPELNGTEVLKKIRRIDNDQRVVIFSGHSPDGAVNDLMALGNVTFLQKPFNVEQILKAVNG